MAKASASTSASHKQKWPVATIKGHSPEPKTKVLKGCHAKITVTNKRFLQAGTQGTPQKKEALYTFRRAVLKYSDIDCYPQT